MKEEIAKELVSFMKDRSTVTIFPAMVTQVDEKIPSCTVEDLNGVSFYDIRLRAALTDTLEGFIVIPAVGSSVLVGNIGNSENAFCVLLYTSVEKVMINIKSVQVEVSDKILLKHATAINEINSVGHKIEKDGETLKLVLNDLIAVLQTLAVDPSTHVVLPATINQLTAITQRINNLLR